MVDRITIDSPTTIDLITFEIDTGRAIAELEDLVDDSEHVRVGLVNYSPVALWGYRRNGMLSPGVPWLIVTPMVKRYKKTFAKLSRPCLQQLLRRCAHLEATIDQACDAHVRYAKWLGFKTVAASNGFYRVRLEAPCD